VLSRFKSFVGLVHGALPRTRIAFVSIKPSLARVSLLGEMKEANALVRKYIDGRPGLTYVDVFTPMLNAAGQPRAELLAPDSLHMNAMGYSLWRRRLSPLVTPLRQR
jgi:lysophospholipase L1-like esterase